MDEAIKAGATPAQRTFHDFGSIPFSGRADALFERHLLSDAVVEPSGAYDRQRFEALARSVRDLLARRWIKTQRTYDQQNPKRIYYMSMEFLIGRSLTNNATNLMLQQSIERSLLESNLDWFGLVEQEPDPGLGNGGLGRLAACFLNSMATLELPAMGYGLRYEYGMFRQSIEHGWQREQPDNWLRRQDPWEISRRSQAVEVTLGCTFEMHRGNLRIIANRPSTLIGIPYDRPVVGFGGKTINSLRLWGAAAQDYFDFQDFSSGDFVGALTGSIAAQTLTRVLYPNDSTEMGQGLRFAQEYFLVACSLADLVRRFRRDNHDWNLLPDKVAIQLNDTHPTLAVPELMRILLDEAHLGWERSWDLTQRTLAYTNHTLLPEALEKWPVRYFQLMLPRHLEIIYEINQRFLDDVRRRFPGDEGRVSRVSLIEEGRQKQGPYGQPGDRRLAQHERRRRDPFRDPAHDDGARPGGDLPRPLQQQDQRRHAAAMAAAGQSRAVARHHRCHRRRLDDRFRQDRRARSLPPTTPRSAARSCKPSATPRRASPPG